MGFRFYFFFNIPPFRLRINKEHFLALLLDSEDGGTVPPKRRPASELYGVARSATPLHPAIVSDDCQGPLKSKVTVSNCSRGSARHCATSSAQETHSRDSFQETESCSSISSDYSLPFAVVHGQLCGAGIVIVHE